MTSSLSLILQIQVLVLACDEFLYAFVIDLRRQYIYSLLEGILHFFAVLKASATQKSLQCWEQVTITCGQLWIMCWILEC